MLHYLFIFFLLAFATISLKAVNNFQLLKQAFSIQSSSDIEQLFPKTVDEMEARFETAKNYTTNQVQNILAISKDDRTFENTVLALDKAVSFFDIYSSILSIIKMVHPNDIIRKRAEGLLLISSEFEIDLFQSNRELYQALKDYQSSNEESLNDERTYYFSNLMEEFKIAGFELENEKFEKLQELRKKIASLSIQFQSNISQDKSYICCTKEELLGIDDDFINSLVKVDDKYQLKGDYPTRLQMLNCHVVDTREKYYQMFKSRAYPANVNILNQIINTRDELSHLLGYKSYAELDLIPTMAESVDNAESFLNDLYAKVKEKMKESWKVVMSDLPESVKLTLDGKMQPWDAAYASNCYFKKHLDIDDQKIAEYFPCESTIKGLLNLYERFLDLKLQVIQEGTFWDPSVRMIEVKNNENNILGYILVDLFPRENKYSHACCGSVIPPMSFDNGKTYSPALAVVIANFSKPTDTKPSLLKHSEVTTFFHEFGHAIHALLGKSEMPTKAAYNTKFDFVETPSQLLEEWIWEPEILKDLSCHYQTGASLPNNILEKLMKKRKLQEKINLGAQIIYAKLCLKLYEEGDNKDLAQIKKETFQEGSQMIACDEDINFLCGFGHLSSYGPKYYTYVWSAQLAKKIFDYIKSHNGLLDPNMGQRYITKIIGRGGSCHPQQMIDDFLEE